MIVLVFGLLVGGRFYTCLWVKSHTSLQEVNLCSRFCHRLWRGSTGCPSQRIGLTRTDRTDGHRWLAAFYVSSLLVTEVSMPSLRDGPWVMLPLLIIVLTLMQRWTHVFASGSSSIRQTWCLKLELGLPLTS